MIGGESPFHLLCCSDLQPLDPPPERNADHKTLNTKHMKKILLILLFIIPAGLYAQQAEVQQAFEDFKAAMMNGPDSLGRQGYSRQGSPDPEDWCSRNPCTCTRGYADRYEWKGLPPVQPELKQAERAADANAVHRRGNEG